MIRLQDFGIKASQYERPTAKWLCGRTDHEQRCPFGPTQDGKCRTTVECFPARKRDRWYCTRLDQDGGKCKEGPLPDGICFHHRPRCVPVKSLRYYRGLTTRWVFFLSIGALLILLTLTNDHVVLSPGNISFQHGTSSKNCSNCHNDSHETTIGLIRSAFSPPSMLDESKRCIKCHDFGTDVMNPHSLPASELNRISSELKETESPSEPLMLSMLRMLNQLSPAEQQENIACATCHREHHGKTATLTRISDEQCQFCHKNRFKSFSVGHPEISGIVFQRRPGIIFTHSNHKGKYYPEDNTPFLCADCHVADVQGQLMQSPKFESGCSICHEEQIQGKGFTEEKGIPVFRLPGFDLEVLMENDIGIGQWPEDADQEMTPFMWGLLSNHELFMRSIPTLKEVDLLDLSNASENELEAVKQLAWSIKQLFFDILRGGHKSLEEQMQSFVNTTSTYADSSGITGFIPEDVIDAAHRDWFPNLVDELKLFAVNNPPSTSFSETENSSINNLISDINKHSDTTKENQDHSDDLDEIDLADFDFDTLDDELELEANPEPEEEKDDQQDLANDEWVSAGGWYRAYFSIFYRPSGHADQFLKHWLTLTSQSAKQANQPASKIFKSLSHPKTSPGQCTKCHSIDKYDDSGISINWLGKHSNHRYRDFTKFSHKAHFSLIEEKGCVTCHVWNTENQTKLTDSYKQSNPFAYTGNFNKLSIDACTECHTDELAGDACLTCHNYHIGQFPDITLTIETQ